MPETPQEIRQKIERLQAIAALGVSNVTLDGVNVSFNLKEIQNQIKDLESKLPGKRRRGAAYGITGLGN